MNLLGYFGDAVPWFLVLAPVVGLGTGVVSARRQPGAPARERRVTIALDVLIALCVLGIATITLLPRPPELPGYAWGVQLVPFASIVDLLADPVMTSMPTVAIRIIGMNIVLFVPLGALIALRTDSLRTTVTVAAAMSVLIEMLQLLLPLGRTTNVDDVILNTIGAAVGAATVLLVRRR